MSIWRERFYEFWGIEVMRHYDFTKLNWDDKSLRRAWFSNFNVDDAEEFKNYFPKLKEYFLIAEPAFGPSQG